MCEINITIKLEIINWILEIIRFSNIDSSIIELLNKWKYNKETPTFNQLVKVSKETNIPFGYFFLEKPLFKEYSIMNDKFNNNIFTSNLSRNLVDTFYSMIDIQNWMIGYVINNGQDKLTYVGSLLGIYNIDILTTNIRKILNLKKKWYENSITIEDSYMFLKRIIEKIGILVMTNEVVNNDFSRVLDINEFRAFTLINEYVPLIFINTSDSDAGKLFSLLHELIHICIGVNCLYNEQIIINENNNIERLCDSVAIEILAPKDIYLYFWERRNGTDFYKINALSKYFKCGKNVIIQRAYELNLITKNKYNKMICILKKQYKKWQTNNYSISGRDFYKTFENELNYRLVTALSNSIKEGKTQYTEAYHLTNTNREIFNQNYM